MIEVDSDASRQLYSEYSVCIVCSVCYQFYFQRQTSAPEQTIAAFHLYLPSLSYRQD